MPAQTADSIAIQLEIQRLNEIQDSIRKSLIGQDSLPPETNDVSILPEPTTDEMQANFDKTMKQMDDEKKVLRNRILLLAGGVLLMIIWMRRIINKQEQKKQKRKDRNSSV